MVFLSFSVARSMEMNSVHRSHNRNICLPYRGPSSTYSLFSIMTASKSALLVEPKNGPNQWYRHAEQPTSTQSLRVNILSGHYAKRRPFDPVFKVDFCPSSLTKTCPASESSNVLSCEPYLFGFLGHQTNIGSIYSMYYKKDACR
jgi:hypothetical protein